MENTEEKKTLDKTDEQIVQIRQGFHSSIDQSETDFEKKITYISAGALAISVTFIDKIVDLSSAQHFWVLTFAWILLAVTLSLNLVSILTSRSLTRKSLKEFDSNILDSSLRNNIANRNKKISNLDLISMLTLLAGIFLIVIFCSLNLDNHKTDNNMSDKDKIEKGRTIQTPAPSRTNTSTDSTSGSGNQNGNSSSSSDSSSDKK
jgi:hypothetical protein